ncbi:DUF4440 domain-containing protein [Actinoplanes sp. LDG1-06]|uniref:DUF4440 domain-containing protein n=1 Tax=Paractinoplanes ovalisporus TaxID=2810368 RepID=A0ABS2AMA4_9ACTN|nr:DUF4440 domain-containing protein [Actinoplanes ovalisporus]MBM2620966.1 DUF4440 domain-containing protein [Actinoplanes ovalisporus]
MSGDELSYLVRTFFAAFTSGDGCTERLTSLPGLFLPEAVIIKTGDGDPAIYTVDSFLKPRRDLLLGGALSEFREWETGGHTEMFGDIAQHFCSYAKAGVLDGIPFTGRGMKTMQFVRTKTGWRISSLAWHDENTATPTTPITGAPA